MPSRHAVIAEEDFSSGRVLRLEGSWQPRVRNLSLAVLTGGLMALAFPIWEVWVLGWVALAPLLFAVARERGAWRAFGLGLVSGTIFFFTSCWWISYPPVQYAGFWRSVAFLLAVVPCVVSGFFFGLFAAIVYGLVRRFGPHALFAAPFAWVGLEWLRLALLGVGWNMLGYSQAFHPLMIQTAAIGGVYAVSFVLAASSTALAYGLVAPSRAAAIRAMAGGLAVIVGNLVFGAVVLNGVEPHEDRFPVVMVQPNFPIEPQVGQSDAIETLARLSFPANGPAGVQIPPPPALVVWPEIPAWIPYDDLPWIQGDVSLIAIRRGDYLLINAPGTSQGFAQKTEHTNAAMLIGPDGLRVGQYDKIRLLPFGEYVPFREVLPFLEQVPALAQDFKAGTEMRVLDVGDGKIGASICFESSFPELARFARGAGASAFVNMTNDAWFGPTAEPRQHLAHSILRSVENRTEQVRATNAGISAHIDAGGRIVDSTELFETATRVWSLPRSPGPMPFYTWAGDWLPLLSLVGLVVLWVVARARPKPPTIELE
jgi:apolipoprotein N-acyltransferase